MVEYIRLTLQFYVKIFARQLIPSIWSKSDSYTSESIITRFRMTRLSLCFLTIDWQTKRLLIILEQAS